MFRSISNLKKRARDRHDNADRRCAIGESFMDASGGTATDRDVFLDQCTAQITEAAYLVALRHGGERSWMDLKLNLWEVLADELLKCRRESYSRFGRP